MVNVIGHYCNSHLYNPNDQCTAQQTRLSMLKISHQHIVCAILFVDHWLQNAQ